MHRILKGERQFELSGLDLEESVFLPFGEEVYESWRAALRGSIAVYLHLCLPIEVTSNPAVERHSHQS